jgi:hypothetical protein
LTADEWWESVRTAALGIMAARDRLAALRAPKGSSGHGSAGGLASDPTGRVAVAVADSESELGETVARLGPLVEDGRVAVVRIGAMMGATEARVMELRYVDALSWEEVSRRSYVSRRSCYRIRDRALELTEDVGVAHLLRGWDYK